MSEQTLRRILGALGILVVLWLISTLLSGRGGGRSGPDGGIAALLDGLDETTVSAVRIVGPDQTVSLQRSGDAWTVNGNVADSAVVTRLWNALAGVEVGGIVANNPVNHGRMGLSADSAWAVDFTLADGGMASVLVGKGGPVFPSGYVRLPDQDAVVVVSGDFRSTVILSLTEWRDKTILRVDTAAVVRVRVGNGRGYPCRRAKRTAHGRSMESPRTPTPCVRFSTSSRISLPSGSWGDGEIFQENPRRVTVLGAERDTLGSVVITGEAGTRHARTPASDVVFEVASFRADRITPDIENLRPADADGA